MSNYPPQSTDEKNYNRTSDATHTPRSKTLGVVGLVFAFLISPVGLIISIIALVKAKKSGGRNGYAVAGIFVGVLGTVILVIGASALMTLIPNFAELAEQCKDLPPGTMVQVNGAEVACP